MAKKLVDSLSGEWKPDEYKDEFRERLKKVIDERLKEKGATTRIDDDDEEPAEDAATNVVDFMALLEQSLASGKRTGAAKKATKATKAAKPAKAAKAPAKKAAKKTARKAPAKKSTARRKAG